jgi:hypothetical protein
VSGAWSGTAPIAYAYRWELCNAAGEACKEVSGALEPTLSPLASDIGSTLRVVVTATNTAGSTSVTSPTTSVVKALLPSNVTLPTISGVLQVGKVLTTGSGSGRAQRRSRTAISGRRATWRAKAANRSLKQRKML